METFVVRIWTAAERDCDPGAFPLRGLVEHVASGAKSAFQGTAELLAFLEASVRPPPQEVEQ